MADRLREWREAAASHVRFRPDRPAIERELADHMEDCLLDLERLGYPADEAEERVLRAMGDPVETGRALDREHAPLLGWLWVVSRWLVGLAVLILAADVFLLQGSVFKYRDLLPPQWPQETAAEFGELTGKPDGGVYWSFRSSGVSDAAAETRDYTLAAPQWAVWESVDGKFVRVYLVLTADARSFGSLENVEFTDDLRFRCPEGEIGNAGNRRQTGGTPVPWASVSHGGLSQGLTRECFRVEMTLHTLPDWVEITYPYGDNDWVLRVELGGVS